jgi:N,N-dimethylformamidase beta subunit-like, C-terminal
VSSAAASSTAASIVVVIVLAAANPLPAAAARHAPRRNEQAIEASFLRQSYRPGDTAFVRVFGATSGLRVQAFRAGPERMHTRRRDVMNGVPAGPQQFLWTPPDGAEISVAIGRWSSGLYFLRLSAADGRIGFAPFVVRPEHLGEHRVAVVLPTQTWQAYNFRDDDGDGIGDTWYANWKVHTALLARPFLDRGVPPHYRHYDAPFLHWLARTHKQADFLTDADLENVDDAKQLAAAYDLIVFSGHHEYVTTNEYDLIERYRDLGGNLMFLFANDFFWRIVKDGNVMERTAQWRDLGRPEAGLIGVQYRGNDRGEHKGPWIVRDTSAAPWLFKDTGLRRGSRFGSGGIEIDATAPSSPVGTRVLAEIPNLFSPGFTAQMTYYETSAGAKVFAAGAFNLVESILEPDKPVPDPSARRNAEGARRMLENLWARLVTP